MTFPRVKPDAWAVNEEVTSAQLNQLDVDHANALDKTGDTLAGTIELVSPGKINMRTGSLIKLFDGASIEVTGTAGVTVSGAGASIVVTEGFLTVGVAGTATFQCLLTASAGVAASTITASSTATFSGNIVMQGTGVLGSKTCSVQSGMDVRIKTGSRIYYENGSSVYFDTSCGIDMIADIAFGAAHTSSYPDGSQIFYQGETTHSATSVETYLNSAETTHESGSSEIWESGAITTFQNAPTMTAGLAVSGSPLVSNDGTVLIGTTTVISSTNTNISGTVTLTGAANTLKLTSRDVQRVLPYRFSRCDSTKWSVDPAVDNNYRVLVAGALADIDLDLPHNAVIKYIEISLQIFGTHGGFPATMPGWTLYRRSLSTTTITSLASRTMSAVSDFSNTIGNYTSQIISMANTSPLSVSIDREQYVYFIRLATEASTNALAGSQYLGTKVTETITEYDEG